MYKKLFVIILALALTLSIGTAALSDQVSGAPRMFSGRGLGYDIMIDDDWYDRSQSQYVGFWRRVDDVKTDELSGWGMVYVVPDITQVPGGTYDETEKWLNENCLAVGGVITHKEGFDTSNIYPGFGRRELEPKGDTHFTLVRPASIDTSGLTDEVVGLAQRLYEGLNDPSHYKTYDVSKKAGMLGSFQAESLNGKTIDASYITDANLTILYFWATYCGPCINTMKAFSDVVDEYASRGVRALGIVTDVGTGDSRGLALAKSIADEQGVTFENIPPVLPSEVMMKIRATPTYLFVNSKGEQVGEPVVGAQTAKGYARLIEEYLG